MNVVDEVRGFLASGGAQSAGAIVVGLSAGPDSTALIHILCEIRDNSTGTFPNLYAVHVNHNLRPGDCDEDSLMAQQMCEKLGVPITTYSVDIASKAAQTGRSEEETGRIERYKLFEEFIENLEEKDVLLAVAHHKGDVAETMLMNLFRGSGLDGLVAPKRVNGNIIRPLLGITKDELIRYLDERGIKYAVDKTNAECEHTRNIWRNDLLPRIAEVSIKKPEDALWEAYELLDMDLSFIKQHVDSAWDNGAVEISGGFCFPVEKLLELDKAISTRIVRMLRYCCVGTVVNFGTIHINNIFDLIRSEVSCASIDMPFDTVALKCDGMLTFVTKDSLKQRICSILSLSRLVLCPDAFDVSLGDLINKNSKIPNSNIQIGASIVENSKAIEYNNLSWCIPYEDESALDRMHIANNLPNVRFTKAGSNCSKELSRLMTDMHIPAEVKDFVVGVVRDGQVIWVPGIGHSEGFVSEASYEAWIRHGGTDGRFIRIEIIREGNNGKQTR